MVSRSIRVSTCRSGSGGRPRAHGVSLPSLPDELVARVRAPGVRPPVPAGRSPALRHRPKHLRQHRLAADDEFLGILVHPDLVVEQDPIPGLAPLERRSGQALRVPSSSSARTGRGHSTQRGLCARRSRAEPPAVVDAAPVVARGGARRRPPPQRANPASASTRERRSFAAANTRQERGQKKPAPAPPFAAALHRSRARRGPTTIAVREDQAAGDVPHPGPHPRLGGVLRQQAPRSLHRDRADRSS